MEMYVITTFLYRIEMLINYVFLCYRYVREINTFNLSLQFGESLIVYTLSQEFIYFLSSDKNVERINSCIN